MRLFFALMLAAALVSCSGLQSPPPFALSVPPAFSANTSRKTFRKGTPLSEFGDRAQRAMTVIYGQWPNPAFVAYPSRGTYYGQTKHRGWSVEVQRGASPKVLRALQAKDGYEANLGENADASARIYPRFRHKHFSWGEAVSFLTQYQNDNTNYVPNNGMLLYEVHGVTSDQRYTVRAQFGLTHPRLTEFGPKVRDYRDDTSKPDSPMQRDRDYLLVERCPDEAFQPSIKDIDALLDSLRPGISP